MRIIKQAIAEFGNEYPLYECTGQQNQNLFKDKIANPINNGGMFSQQPVNPQNVSTMISSQLPTGNIPNLNQFNNPNNVMGNQGQNSKDAFLVPIKKRCEDYEYSIDINGYV